MRSCSQLVLNPGIAKIKLWRNSNQSKDSEYQIDGRLRDHARSSSTLFADEYCCAVLCPQIWTRIGQSLSSNILNAEALQMQGAIL